jgi:hypothetical protein
MQEIAILCGISTRANANKNLDITAMREKRKLVLRSIGTTAGV